VQDRAAGGVKVDHSHRHDHTSHFLGEESLDGAPARQEGIQVKSLIEGGLLYIGIPAATLYPLGFIGAHYPFAFGLAVGFDQSEDGLMVTIAVENPNDEPMPADVGFHPAFNWPLTPGRTKDEYAVVFDQDDPAPVRRGGYDPVLLYPEGEPTPVEGKVLRPRDEMFAGSPSCSTGGKAVR
jgi:hypothetical protein